MDVLRRQADQHYVVTGGNSGIGRAVALRLAREGARLTLLARRMDLLSQSAVEVLDAGAAYANVACCDIRDREAVDAVFADAADKLGPLRGLISASGIGGPHPADSPERWTSIVDTNLTGTYWCLRAAERHLAPGPEVRHLVVVSSVLGRFGVPGYTAYCASKSALLGLTRALALELAGSNVQVNAVCPGWVGTDMAWQGLAALGQELGITKEEAWIRARKAVPLARMSAPEDVAGLIAWLLSADARGVTGQGIDMNNGAWMG